MVCLPWARRPRCRCKNNNLLWVQSHPRTGAKSKTGQRQAGGDPRPVPTRPPKLVVHHGSGSPGGAVPLSAWQRSARDRATRACVQRRGARGMRSTSTPYILNSPICVVAPDFLTALPGAGVRDEVLRRNSSIRRIRANGPSASGLGVRQRHSTLVYVWLRPAPVLPWAWRLRDYGCRT